MLRVLGITIWEFAGDIAMDPTDQYASGPLIRTVPEFLPIYHVFPHISVPYFSFSSMWTGILLLSRSHFRLTHWLDETYIFLIATLPSAEQRTLPDSVVAESF